MKKTGVIEITQVEYLDAYRLRLSFSDDHQNTVDFGPFLKKTRNPANTKYRDLKRFKEFSTSEGDLNWNDYEMSFSLEDVYTRKVM